MLSFIFCLQNDIMQSKNLNISNINQIQIYKIPEIILGNCEPSHHTRFWKQRYQLLPAEEWDLQKLTQKIPGTTKPLSLHSLPNGYRSLQELQEEKAKEPKFIWIVNNTGHHGAHQWHRVEYEGNVIRFFDLHLK